MSLRFAVLISGRGSNMLALERATRDGRIDGADRLGHQRPRGRTGPRGRPGARTRSVGPRSARGEDREAFGLRLSDRIRERGAELVALAGFMRILSGGFVREWQGRLLNIHPSLLPAFRGLHTHRRVLEAGERDARLYRAFRGRGTRRRPRSHPGKARRCGPARTKARFQRAFSVWNTLSIRGRSAGSPPGGSHGGTALRCWTGARRDP